MPEDSELRKDIEGHNAKLNLGGGVGGSSSSSSSSGSSSSSSAAAIKGHNGLGSSSNGLGFNHSISNDNSRQYNFTNDKLPPNFLRGVLFEMNIPNEFPLKPPAIRIVHPQLRGGYSWPSGAICFEALTESGWAATMSLVSLANALVAFLNDKGNPVSLP